MNHIFVARIEKKKKNKRQHHSVELERCRNGYHIIYLLMFLPVHSPLLYKMNECAMSMDFVRVLMHEFMISNINCFVLPSFWIRLSQFTNGFVFSQPERMNGYSVNQN